jgi:hypothetical protein
MRDRLEFGERISKNAFAEVLLQVGRRMDLKKKVSFCSASKSVVEPGQSVPPTIAGGSP